MKSLPECEKALATYSSGPIILVAGRDAVAHAKALLCSLQNLVGAITIKSPEIQGNIDDAYRVIAKAEGKP